MEHTVLVTGASAGFGEATARHFLASGHQVIALGKEVEHLEALKSSLPAEQQKKLLTLAVDLCDSAQLDHLALTLPVEFANVTLLVNIAGLDLAHQPAHQALPIDWVSVVDTNIKGLVHMTRAFLPGMVERQRGHVINIGSVAAKYPYPEANVYGGTKAFIHQFSLNLRADLLGTPVRVTCVEADVRSVGDDNKALSANDVAEAIYWSANLPSHLNVNVLELMPVQ